MKVTNASANDTSATGNSTDPMVGNTMRIVIEMIITSRKLKATRSPFSRGLNWHFGHVSALASSSSYPHRLQTG